MQTTRLSSKGQVIIPKSVRANRRWSIGQELVVVDTDEGVLLRPRGPFEPTSVSDVAGALRDRVSPMTDAEIDAALDRDARKKWHGRR